MAIKIAREALKAIDGLSASDAIKKVTYPEIVLTSLKSSQKWKKSKKERILLILKTI